MSDWHWTKIDLILNDRKKNARLQIVSVAGMVTYRDLKVIYAAWPLEIGHESTNNRHSYVHVRF